MRRKELTKFGLAVLVAAGAAMADSNTRTFAVMHFTGGHLRGRVDDGPHLIALHQLERFDVAHLGEPFVYRTEILVTGVQQLLEAVDHEVGLLKVVDLVLGAHHAQKVEGDPIGRLAFERKGALAPVLDAG